MNEHEAKTVRWAMVLLFLAWAVEFFLPPLAEEPEEARFEYPEDER